jgi:glycogen debranching enzyme
LDGLWDEEYGFYCNRRTDTGAFSRRISPTNFYALFSPSVPKERLRRIVDGHYFNPEEFYGDWMLPSIARNDPAFPDQDYWRGRVWAPLNFLVYMALLGHDLPDVRRDLAEKSAAIFLKEWDERRHVHENYNSITGEGCDAHNSDRFYHWGALLPVIALAERGLLPGFGGPLETSHESGGE